MLVHRSLLLPLGLLAATTIAAPVAKNPALGTWNGHLEKITWAQPKSAKQQPSADEVKKVISALNKVTISLTIKKDGNYVAVTTANGAKQKPSYGKWKLKGHALTLTPIDSSSEHEYGTIAANGKSILFTLPPKLLQAGVRGHAVFMKAKS